MNHLKNILKIHAECQFLTSMYPNSREFENKIREEQNAKTRKNAEMVFKHYISDGYEIAIERKNAYLKNNLI